MIRSFDWRDFPILHRNRNEGIWLDPSLALTRWMALVPAGALLASLAPATGIFTYVARDDGNGGEPIVGQLSHGAGSVKAKLTFITPERAIETAGMSRLLDHLAKVAGERGAHNLLAEVPEVSPVYETLQRSGFAIYTRQRFWSLGVVEPDAPDASSLWRQVGEEDEQGVHYLYHSLVPALVQQTEPPPWENMNGVAYSEDGEVVAYVHLAYGPTGILAQPFVHTGTDHARDLLASLYEAIPNARSRPIYLCVRSHQAWLAPFLDELGFESGPRQAVMVKRLVVPLRDAVPARLNNAGMEITTTTTSFGKK
ncbi:MAG TPA: hypothetical protein VMN57_16545 [Anaerolineales bacterium]|nr:hypothetical protein [Anaerolineales bacterium]